MAELISDNAEQRAFTAAAMNTLQCKLNVGYRLGDRLTDLIFVKTHSPHGYLWFGFSRFINPMVGFEVHTPQVRIILMFPLQVTPGNRAAAVVGGLNVIVFTSLAILAHREKVRKIRDNRNRPISVGTRSSSPSIDKGDEKKLHLVDEKDINPVVKLEG